MVAGKGPNFSGEKLTSDQKLSRFLVRLRLCFIYLWFSPFLTSLGLRE